MSNHDRSSVSEDFVNGHLTGTDGAGKFEPRHVSTPEELNLRPKKGQRLIHLTRGYVTIVSATQYEQLVEFKWNTLINRATGRLYAVRKRRGYEKNPNKTVYMHREIAQAPRGLVVDHMDGCGLNNTDENLVVTTFEWNNHNHVFVRGGISFRGVWRRPRNGKVWYRAGFCFEGRRYHLGDHETPEAAARAYDDKAIEMLGQFAWTNFPRGIRDPKKKFIVSDDDVPF